MPSVRCDPLNITLTVEELGLSGTINLGICSRSTAYRDVKRINAYLERNHYDWRVKLSINKNKHMPYDLIVI